MKKHALSVALALLVLAVSVSTVFAGTCGTCPQPAQSCGQGQNCTQGCCPKADCNALVNGMGAKLYRGVVNTLTGWWEVPAQIGKGYRSGCGPCGGDFGGAFFGLFKGLYFAVGRTLNGAGEVAGFWAADTCDNCNVGFALDSEYAWSDCPTTCAKCQAPKPCSCSPCSMELGCLEPIGNKLMRGLGNVLFGIAEIPGQIVKGAKCCAPDMGIVKGFWYFMSREIGGAMDVATFLLPNPSDTKALAFNEKWPWTAWTDYTGCGPCADKCEPCAKPAPCAPCSK